MCLCGTLLALLKNPRHTALCGVIKYSMKLGLALEQRSHRITQMTAAFPEARVPVPPGIAELLTGIPDRRDRHVLAAAICGHAQVIVTGNTKDFPAQYLAKFDMLCHSADEFLIHLLSLDPHLVVQKLDAQAANIGRKRRDVLVTLKRVAPKFVERAEAF
jgi:hypothetical protein